MEKVKNSHVFQTFFLILTITMFCAYTSGKVIYVDDDAISANDGTSWTDAYRYLQDGLSNALSGDEVRVAQGVYRPDEGISFLLGDRDATFQLINSVSLKGGYAGIGMQDPNARDIEIFETILSGDLAVNDIIVADPCDLMTESTRAENSRHVVTGSATDTTAVLDGFIITAGNADGPSWQETHGGGLRNLSGNPTITNCIFINNSALRRGGGIYNLDSNSVMTDCSFIENAGLHGGGVCNTNSSPEIKNCEFISNVAGHGGGVSNAGGDPVLLNCSFNKNLATISGGGIRNINTEGVTLFDCIFTDNLAEDRGGGIFNQNSSPDVVKCQFIGNIASFGGGIANFQESSATITNCTFSNNSAENQGGGIQNENASTIVTHCSFSTNSAFGGAGIANSYNSNSVVNNCIFNENIAQDYGGGMHNNESSAIVMNCLFTRNQAIWGGGIENSFHGNSTIKNCVFSANVSLDQGGGIFINNASPTITNCLFTGNSALGGGGMGIFFYSAPVITNCTFSDNIVEGGGSCINSYWYSAPVVKNCILRSDQSISGSAITFAPDSSTIVSYSNIEGGWTGLGNIDADPLFAYHGYWVDINDPNIVVEPNEPDAMWIDGDYHIKSNAGRWDPNNKIWIIDDTNSPCIDAGDPNDYVGLEQYLNGGIINMGTYGGTLEASKSSSGPISGINQFVFLSEQSTLIQTGGIQGVNLAYRIEGQFYLTVDLDARTASFSQVDVTAIDDGPPVQELNLNNVFNLDSLEGSICNDGTINFYGQANDNSNIILDLNFSNDLIHFIGETFPPDESNDFFIFNIDALAQKN